MCVCVCGCVCVCLCVCVWLGGGLLDEPLQLCGGCRRGFVRAGKLQCSARNPDEAWALWDEMDFAIAGAPRRVSV